MNPLLEPSQPASRNPATNNQAAFFQTVKSIKKSIDGLRALTSPQAALNHLIKDNPQMQQAVQFAQQCGGDPKAAMELLARQNGVDVQQIYEALK